MRINYFLFFALLITVCNAQPYIPMLEEDNQWDIAYWSFWGGGFVSIGEISIIGEEIINGKTYKVIYVNGDISNCRLREENGVVYSYDQQIDEEKIMLDLNVEIGDIISEDFFCFGGGGGTIWEYKVVDIYMDFIAGEDRKVVLIEGFDILGEPFGYFEYWIEGIGSNNGLAPFGYNYDFYNILTCFKNNGEVHFINGFTTCTPTLRIDDFSSEEISLYPNPVTHQSILKIPVKYTLDRIVVLDINGRIIKDEIFQNEDYTINAIDFKSGIYFYHVFNDSRVIKSSQFIVK